LQTQKTKENTLLAVARAR